MNSIWKEKQPSPRMKQLKTISRMVQSCIYILGAVFHFVGQEIELTIIPPFLPWRRAALYITGVFEFLGGVGLLVPRFRRFSGRGLALLLVAIWPANIYHAVADMRSGRWQKSRLYHIMRFPLQMVLIVWVLWTVEREE